MVGFWNNHTSSTSQNTSTNSQRTPATLHAALSESHNKISFLDGEITQTLTHLGTPFDVSQLHENIIADRGHLGYSDYCEQAAKAYRFTLHKIEKYHPEVQLDLFKKTAPQNKEEDVKIAEWLKRCPNIILYLKSHIELLERLRNYFAGHHLHVNAFSNRLKE